MPITGTLNGNRKSSSYRFVGEKRVTSPKTSAQEARVRVIDDKN